MKLFLFGLAYSIERFSLSTQANLCKNSLSPSYSLFMINNKNTGGNEVNNNWNVDSTTRPKTTYLSVSFFFFNFSRRVCEFDHRSCKYKDGVCVVINLQLLYIILTQRWYLVGTFVQDTTLFIILEQWRNKIPARVRFYYHYFETKDIICRFSP